METARMHGTRENGLEENVMTSLGLKPGRPDKAIHNLMAVNRHCAKATINVLSLPGAILSC